jgi:cathepsin E
VDNLYSQGTIPEALIGISFEPTNSDAEVNGELTFGGVDESKFTGAIVYTPITTTSPASNYWGIDQTITYGASTSIMASSAGIVDTGTTLILLATGVCLLSQALKVFGHSPVL